MTPRKGIGLAAKRERHHTWAAALAQGKTRTEIAREYGVTRGTVTHGLARVGVKPAKVGRPARDFPVAEWVKLYESGVTCDAIAALHEMETGQSVHKTVVGDHLRRAGVTMRKGPYRTHDWDAVLRLHAKGLSFLAIEAVTGVSDTQVARIVKAHMA